MSQQSPVTEADFLDLSKIVHRIRRASLERSRIPEHSGTASSQQRKKHRAERRRLTIAIKEAESEMIAWGLSIVPVTDIDINKEFVAEVEETTFDESPAGDEPEAETVVV